METGPTGCAFLVGWFGLLTRPRLYEKVVKRAKEMGLTNLDIQEYWWLQR
jgi:hypothetical protein